MFNISRCSVIVSAWISVFACSSSSGDIQKDGAIGGASGGLLNHSGAAPGTGARPAAGGACGASCGNPKSGGAGTGGTTGLVVAGGKTATNGGANVGGRGGIPAAGGKIGAGGLGPQIAMGGTAGSGGFRPNSGGTASGGLGTGGGTPSGEPTARELLNKVSACSATAQVVRGGFGLDGGSGDLSIYGCEGAVYWKADLDIDCDGIQTPPCDTDETGQPQTSIVDDAPQGDVDPTVLPYFVIPLGDPESNWYQSFGIELGQVGAVIYKGTVHYGIFADEAGGAFIGEASYAMCQLFLGKPSSSGDPCDPNHGGIDAAEITYVTFTGAANRAVGADIYSHERHTDIGIAAAKQWVSE